jgi:gas vesicle protein
MQRHHRTNQLGNTLAALVVGAAIGVGAGILFAPDEGKKTRKKIKKSFDQSRDDLSDKIDDLKNQVRHVVERKKHDLEDSIDHFVSTAGKKRDEVITALEKKLAELKKETEKVAANAKK